MPKSLHETGIPPIEWAGGSRPGPYPSIRVFIWYYSWTKGRKCCLARWEGNCERVCGVVLLLGKQCLLPRLPPSLLAPQPIPPLLSVSVLVHSCQPLAPLDPSRFRGPCDIQWRLFIIYGLIFVPKYCLHLGLLIAEIRSQVHQPALWSDF